MSEPSPVFANLSSMLQSSRDRMEALDTPDADDAFASRVWCRQRFNLALVLLAEPPVTIADALIVLAALSEWRDLMEGVGDDMTEQERRDLDEVTTVALVNVNICFGAQLACHEHYTPDFRETLVWLDRQADRWAPRTAKVVA